LTTYVIDASSLMEPNKRYYAMDICPGFWEWLDKAHAVDQVCSVEEVRDEIKKGDDELITWAKERGGFFLSRDNATQEALTEINAWAYGAGYERQVVHDFFDGADPVLVAFALAHERTVVTEEVLTRGQLSKIKIPRVCQEFGVPWTSAVGMVRAEGVRLVLGQVLE